MAKRDIIVIGASAGGIAVLKDLVTQLPAQLDATIFVVQHLSAHAPSYLPEILNRAGLLRAVHPKDGELIERGRIYVAPPDHHLLVENDRVVVKKGPKENRFRPSIDALFRSAAYNYGPRVIGVVLTGLLNDGTSGMWSIKRLGGVGVIQAPDDAEYPSMPTSVLEYVDVDYIIPVAEMATLLCQLTQEDVIPEPSVLSEAEGKRIQTEIQIAAQGDAFNMGILDMGKPTSLTCPECNGVLVSIKEGKLVRYRCHTGHGFTADALMADLSKSVEEKFWQIVRGLEETVILLDATGENYAENGDAEAARRFHHKAEEVRDRAHKIRELIFEQEPLGDEKVRANGQF